MNSTHNSGRRLHSEVSRAYISTQLEGDFEYSHNEEMVTI